jgi:uncharacterized protein (DUF342 family)
MGAAESLRENRLRVVVSDDLLEAYVIADSALEMARAEVVAFLVAEGIAGPVDDAGLATFVDEHPVGVAVRVVRGRAPVSGFEARIDYPFKSLEERGGVAGGEREPFAMDHRETRALERCEAGDVLARKLAGVEAVDGVDAYGRALPAERGREVKLAAGSNASLSDDGESVVASIAGVPSRDASGRIVVNPAVTVKNVDFKSGNVHFEGSVLVEGDVLQGFSVEAGGDVEVKGSVEHATIRAGGSIHVKGGVRRHSVLRAARDVEVRFADSECHLEARGWVRVAQNAIQCELIGDEGVSSSARAARCACRRFAKSSGSRRPTGPRQAPPRQRITRGTTIATLRAAFGPCNPPIARHRRRRTRTGKVEMPNAGHADRSLARSRASLPRACSRSPGSPRLRGCALLRRVRKRS